MRGPIKSFVPHAFVRNVSASIKFYGRLGFEIGNSFTPEGEATPSWCWLRSAKGDLMLGRADGEIDAEQQGVLFYAYCDDIESAHAELSGWDMAPDPITKPFYNPGGEFRVRDPDGYAIWFAQF